MDKKEFFKHFMLAGHGRAFELLKGNEEEFRDIVLYGCMNDISFDMQCEGSRSWFMYNLASQYENYEYFLAPSIEKFLSDEVNTDWHIICHLSDFINRFALDNGNDNARRAIDKKYDELYSLIMSMKFSLRARRVIESYEYLAMTIVQRGDFSQALRIFKDMGAYFIKRRRVQDDDLEWLFDWFFTTTKNEFGEQFIEQQLDENCQHSKEIARFRRVMIATKRTYESPSFVFLDTADEIIEKIDSSSVMRRDIVFFSRKAYDSEKYKLAQAVLAEKDLDKKEKLLSVFTFAQSVFPMNPQPIIEYAKSENTNLRDTALYALSYLRADCVHDFAVELLEKSFSTDALEILIRNYQECDKEYIFRQLGKMTIDPDDTSGWHSVVRQILETDNEIFLPDEFLTFIYENSLCSGCRENAVKKLLNRNLLTDKMISECLLDCNEDIRAEVGKLV